MKTKNVIVSFLSVLSVSLFPCFFLFFHNTGTAVFKDFLGISSIIASGCIVIIALSFLLLRDIGKAALITNIIMAVLLYFAYIENAVLMILPMVYYWHVALICIFLVVQSGIFIHKKVPSNIAYQLNKGLLLIYAGLILFNGIITIPKIVESSSQNIQSNNQSPIEQITPSIKSESNELPNVYYFIFDEFGGYDNIKRYCDYDNSGFYNSLEQFGFVTSKHSVNGTIESITEIPNLLQLRQVNSVEMTAIDKKANLKDPYLFILMKENGYQINAIDLSNDKFIDMSHTDTRLTSDFSSSYGTFSSYIIENTAFYPFYGSEDQEHEIKRIFSMFDYAMESSTKAESNLFTIGYFSFPHVPYIVDEYGNKTSDADRLNLGDPDAYLGQFKYASKRIIELVNEIITNDPNSIIILQSDHGYRLASHLHFWYGIDKYDLAAEFQFERNILNAVYYQGENIEIEGLSGLNTLRVVLNKLLNADFEMID